MPRRAGLAGRQILAARAASQTAETVTPEQMLGPQDPVVTDLLDLCREALDNNTAVMHAILDEMRQARQESNPPA